MTPTSASPPLDAAPPTGTAGWTPRLVAVLVALIWPTQLLAAAGILGANATASVAQSFRTTHVAWFGLTVVLVSTLLTPFVMKLGDRYGKKRLMLVMTGLGVVGDVVAAMAGSFWLLLVGRAVAGCYGPFAALSFPAVRDVFPARLVKPASAVLGSSVGLVALVAPFLAGWLVDGWGYEGVMWFLAAASAVGFALIAFLVPQTPRHDRRPGFDWLGGLVLGGGLTAVVYAVGQGQSWGGPTPGPWAGSPAAWPPWSSSSSWNAPAPTRFWTSRCSAAARSPWSSSPEGSPSPSPTPCPPWRSCSPSTRTSPASPPVSDGPRSTTPSSA